MGAYDKRKMRLLQSLYIALILGYFHQCTADDQGKLGVAMDELGVRWVKRINEKLKEPMLTLLATSEFATKKEFLLRTKDGLEALVDLLGELKQDPEFAPVFAAFNSLSTLSANANSILPSATQIAQALPTPAVLTTPAPVIPSSVTPAAPAPVVSTPVVPVAPVATPVVPVLPDASVAQPVPVLPLPSTPAAPAPATPAAPVLPAPATPDTSAAQPVPVLPLPATPVTPAPADTATPVVPVIPMPGT